MRSNGRKLMGANFSWLHCLTPSPIHEMSKEWASILPLPFVVSPNDITRDFSAKTHYINFLGACCPIIMGVREGGYTFNRMAIGQAGRQLPKK